MQSASKLSAFLFALAFIAPFGLTTGAAVADPVELPCDPADCPPIDPCTLAPERCNPPGGEPIPAPEPQPSDDSTDSGSADE